MGNMKRCGWCQGDHHSFQCRTRDDALETLNLDRIGVENLDSLLDTDPEDPVK